MADPVTNKVNFIYENHKNLQIEVPSSQQLRETPIGVATEENTAEIEKPVNDTAENVVVNIIQVTGDKSEFSSDASVFVPVLTVTKEEAAYTTSKGDTKLQKVSIKEKLSEVDIESKNKMEVVANPFSSEVVSVVIPGPHELRAATLDREVSEEPMAKKSSNDILDGDQKSEEKKAKTKIPVLKFKQMVDKVKQEKKKENKQEATPIPRRNPRRSSIPRIKKSRRNSASAEKDDTELKPEVIVKGPNILANETIHIDKLPGEKNDAKPKPEVIVKEPNIVADETMHIDIPPEDEFNKLFADIINNETPETIIVSPIEDPEKLENKFEEIVHDYEENKIQPINVEKIKYSKIPLLKRTSENEVNVPKNLLRATPLGDDRYKKSSNKEFPQSNDDTKKLKSAEDNNTGESKEVVENKRKGSVIVDITIPVPIREASKLTDDPNKQIIFAETKIPVRKRLSEQDIHAPTGRKSSNKDSILLSDCNAKNTIENKDNLQNTEIKSENEIDTQNKDTIRGTDDPISFQECELSGEPKKVYLDKDIQNMVNKVIEEREKKSYKKPLLRRESDKNIQKFQDINRSTLKKSISVDESNLKSDFPTSINVKDKPQQEIEDVILKPNKLKDSEQENNKSIQTAPKRELLKELKDINEQDERKFPQETKEMCKTYEKKVPKRGSDDKIQNAEPTTKPELKKSFSVGDSRQKIDDTNTEINHKIKSIDNIKQLQIVDVGQFTKKTENERVSLINEITLPTSIRNVPKEIEDKYTNINEEIHNISSKEEVSTTDNKIKQSKVPFTDRGVHHIQVPREIIRLNIERNIPTDKNSIGDLTHSGQMDHKNDDAVDIKTETKIAENTKTTVGDDEKAAINSVKNEITLPVPIRKPCKESEVGEKLSDDELKLPNIKDDKMTTANTVRDVNVTILKPDVIELDANSKNVPEEESKDNIKINEPFGGMSLPHKKTTSVDKINEENIRIVTDNSFEGTVSQDSISPNETTIPNNKPKLFQEKVTPNLNINYTPDAQLTPHPKFEQTALTTTPKNNKRNNIPSKNTDLILSPTIQDKLESDNYWQKKSSNQHIEVLSPQKGKRTIYRAFNRIDIEENIKKEETATVLTKEEFIEDPPVLKGKVSRLISRLHSVEPRPETHSKEFVKEIPKERLVLTKIAMFERQESNDTIPQTEVMPQQDKKLKYNVPKIVEVILKTPPERRRSSLNDTGPKVDISKAENKGQTQKNTEPASEGSKINEKVVLPNDYRHEAVLYEKEYDKFKTEHVKDKNVLTIQADTGKVLNDSERNKTLNKDETTVKTKSNGKRPLLKKNKADVAKSNNELSGRTYHDELKSDEDSNLKRVKSLAELDLGNAVKGKVRDMVTRINSIEVLEEKKEVISIKERPRKKSVSTIIALFEGKLTPVQYEALKKANTHGSYKSRVVANQTPNMTANEVYEARLTELSTASLTYGKMDNVSRVKLSNGVEMPVLALGTALVEDVLGEGKIESINVQHKNGDSSAELEPRMLFHIITTAIEIGYRAIDTAFIYGNQKEVGEAIRAKIDDGTVLREDLFISNKLWSTFHRPDLVEKACRDSLEVMGLSYFDLYMIHNPMSFKEDGDAVPMKDGVVEESQYDYMDAWSMMEKLVPLGLVRSIGVSNFNVSQVARVLKGAKIPPVVNQVECHPYLTEDALHDYCAQHNVQLNCFGVLGSKGTPADLKSHTSPVIDDPLVKVLASGLNMTPAELLIRYQLERGHTATVKASTGSHLWENLQAVNLSLSLTEVNALQGLNRNKRTFTYKGMGDTHKNYPFLESV